jgi:hypothetical protein
MYYNTCIFINSFISFTVATLTYSNSSMFTSYSFLCALLICVYARIPVNSTALHQSISFIIHMYSIIHACIYCSSTVYIYYCILLNILAHISYHMDCAFIFARTRNITATNTAATIIASTRYLIVEERPPLLV